MPNLNAFPRFLNPLAYLNSFISEPSDPSNASQTTNTIPPKDVITPPETEEDTDSDTTTHSHIHSDAESSPQEPYYCSRCACQNFYIPAPAAVPSLNLVRASSFKTATINSAPISLTPTPTELKLLYTSLLTHLYKASYPSHPSFTITLMVKTLIRSLKLSRTETPAQRLAKYKDGIYRALGNGNGSEMFEKVVRVVEMGTGKTCTYHGWLSGKGGCLCEEFVLGGEGMVEGVEECGMVGFNWRGFVERGVVEFYGMEGRWE